MSTPAAFEKLFNECYTKFYAKVFMTEMCPKKLISLTVTAMEIAEFANVPGPSQKSLVIRMLQKFINDSSINEQSKKYYLKLTENGLISAVIEVVIAGTKHKMDVNNPVVVKTRAGC